MKASFGRSLTLPAAEGIDVTQARRLLRLTLLAPAVIEKLLADTDALINLESVLRRVMPLDWQEHSVLWSHRVRNGAVTDGAAIVAGLSRVPVAA